MCTVHLHYKVDHLTPKKNKKLSVIIYSLMLISFFYGTQHFFFIFFFRMPEVLFDNESDLYCQNKLINIKWSM